MLVELDCRCHIANPLFLFCGAVHRLSLDYRVDSVGVEIGLFRGCRVVHQVAKVVLAHFQASYRAVGDEVRKLAASRAGSCLGGVGVVEGAVNNEPLGDFLADFHSGIVLFVAAVDENTVFVEVGI